MMQKLTPREKFLRAATTGRKGEFHHAWIVFLWGLSLCFPYWYKAHNIILDAQSQVAPLAIWAAFMTFIGATQLIAVYNDIFHLRKFAIVGSIIFWGFATYMTAVANTRLPGVFLWPTFVVQSAFALETVRADAMSIKSVRQERAQLHERMEELAIAR